jgi:hypothetical protein
VSKNTSFFFEEMTSKVQTANASKHNLAKFMTIAISKKKNKFWFSRKKLSTLQNLSSF